MRKKMALLAAILISAIMAPGMVFAQSGVISVWSFTDEVERITNDYFNRDNSNITTSYNHIPTDQFENRLDPLLASGRGAPDVFALESAFVRKYVESGLLMDLTDIYEANRNRLIAFPAQVGTYNGRVYALSWQAYPGAMFYRRSLARRYLGTDDPAVVQTYFENFNKFLNTARTLHERSNGSCVVVASRDDLLRPFLGARTQPWVVNNRLVIDPVMEHFMYIAKELYDNRYEGCVSQWSDAWFGGMDGRLGNREGRQVEVFSYFFPNWGLQYVIKTNTIYTSSSNDWAMIQGPSAWYWGGTWLAVRRDTPNAEAAREFIRYAATNDDFLRRWAEQSGDLVPSNNVVNRIRNNFREEFLGGQNHYSEFARYAARVNGSLAQATDDTINAIFGEEFTAYVYGQKSKAQALADFRARVTRQLGIR